MPGQDLAKMFEMFHISLNNHAIIISWKFHPNPISFKQIIAIFRFFSKKCEKFSKCKKWVKMGQNGSKWSKKNFYCFFLRIEWFWVKKKKKTFLTIFGSGGPFLSPFCPFFRKMRLFSKNLFLHVFSPYGPLTSCKELGKSLEPFSRAPAG